MSEQKHTPEPFGFFKAHPFGWTDCAETEEGSTPLFDKQVVDSLTDRLAELEKQEPVGIVKHAVGGPVVHLIGEVKPQTLLYAAPPISPEVEKLKTELEAARKDAGYKQSRIDELMLEYCPSDMTDDQLKRWRECQIPAIEQAKGGV